MEKRATFLSCLLLFVLAAAFVPSIHATENGKSGEPILSEGTLMRAGAKQEPVPLKKTNVKVSIVGFIAAVDVEQTFINHFKENIEAIYVFPLPSEAAVTDMEIKVGSRIIRSVVKEREEAKSDYENARNTGHRAALLEQQRPNVFTASIANIRPGKKIMVRIRYTQQLNYDDGGFRLSFPMVVAPRYTPPRTLARQVAGTETDAPLITPPLLPPDRRPGTNISITVDLDSGIPVKEINSISHDIVKVEYSPTHYLIQLANPMEIPNKDFILEYKIADEKPQAALVQGVNEKGDGYFLLMATPPAASEIKDLSPKEMILIIDRSGSMGGEKIIQAKKALGICLEGLNPQDSFNIIKFDDSFDSMSTNSLPVTKETLAAGQGFIDAIQVRGGTEMLEPLSHALQQPKQQGRVRVIVFFTDGQVGNELEILQEVKKNLGDSRIFTFGIDTAVNEYFLKKLAQLGRGTAEFLLPDQKDIEPIVGRFQKRVSSPIFTDLAIDWGGMNVSDASPDPLPDLFLNQPAFVTGRYRPGGTPQIKLKASSASGSTTLAVAVDANLSEARADILSALWARNRIERLSDQMIENPEEPKLKEEIIKLAMEHRLVSPFTSFVAIEQQVAMQGGRPPRPVMVPSAMPAGWAACANSVKLGHLSSLTAFNRTATGKSPNTGSAAPTNSVPDAGKVTPQPITTDRKPVAGKGRTEKATPVIAGSPVSGSKSVKDISLPVSVLPVTQPAPVEPTPAAPAIEARPSVESAPEPLLNFDSDEEVLRYLSQRQSPSGGWGDTSNAETLRTTALAALVFISSGNTSNHSGYQFPVRRALDLLARNIDQNGMLRGITGQRLQTETQALALWALTEDMRFSSKRYQDAAEELFKGLLKLRDGDGLWLAREGGKESMRATVWAAMAISSSIKAGIAADKQLQEVAELLSKKGGKSLESRLIMILAGRPANYEIEQFKNKLLAKDWISQADTKYSKALFALLVLRRLDRMAYSTLESQLRAATIDRATSISVLALRYLVLTSGRSSLAALR